MTLLEELDILGEDVSELLKEVGSLLDSSATSEAPQPSDFKKQNEFSRNINHD